MAAAVRSLTEAQRRAQILSSADAAAANPIAQRIVERVAAVRVDGFGKPIC